MDPELRGLLDREQIRDLVTRYSIAVDSKDLTSLVELFDPHLDNDKYGKGREGVRAYSSRFTTGEVDGRALHFVANHQVDVRDDEHATGVVYVRAFAGADGAWMDVPAIHLDEYVRRDGRWYFRVRWPAELAPVSLEAPWSLGYQSLADRWKQHRARQAERRGDST